MTISVINDSRQHLKTQLVDVLDNTGKFLKLEDVQQKLPLRLTQLEYFGLQKAIKKEWQNNIKLHKFEPSGQLDDGPYLTVNRVSKPLTSQHIYWELINPQSKPPSSLDIWVDLFPFLDKLDWSNIFTLVNRITCEPYLQTFQYKVLNRTLNCRYNLYKWKISQSPFCRHCNGTHVDTIEHHLFWCHKSCEFWHELESWLTIKLELTTCINFTICEILLGIPFRNDPELLSRNFIFLLGKWYINKKKSQDQIIHLSDFLAILKSKLIILQSLYRLKEQTVRFNESFEKLIDKLL